jgi:hypothetical protein
MIIPHTTIDCICLILTLPFARVDNDRDGIERTHSPSEPFARLFVKIGMDLIGINGMVIILTRSTRAQ